MVLGFELHHPCRRRAWHPNELGSVHQAQNCRACILFHAAYMWNEQQEEQMVMELTINLSSLVKVNLSTANMRSKGSSESLILLPVLEQARCSMNHNSTQQIYLVYPDNASTRGWVLAPSAKLAMKDACVDHFIYTQGMDSE
jgi:hypothetical protein